MLRFSIIGEVHSQTHEHQTDGDYFDNTFPPNEVNVTEDGLESDGPGPSQWGPDINFDTFGDIETAKAIKKLNTFHESFINLFSFYIL